MRLQGLGAGGLARSREDAASQKSDLDDLAASQCALCGSDRGSFLALQESRVSQRGELFGSPVGIFGGHVLVGSLFQNPDGIRETALI